MFYGYYDVPRSNKTTVPSASSYRTTVSNSTTQYSPQQSCRCRPSIRSSKQKLQSQEIPRDAVMELFDLHQNRTSPKCFEDFIPLYPKSSSLLFGRYRAPRQSVSFFKEWLARLERSTPNSIRLIIKAFIECDVELKIFNEINKMNEEPMIPEVFIKQSRPQEILLEDLLLFLTNIRLRDILKLKKDHYQMWTEEYAKSLAKSDEEALLEVEALYVTEMDLSSSNSSNHVDSNDSCEAHKDASN